MAAAPPKLTAAEVALSVRAGYLAEDDHIRRWPAFGLSTAGRAGPGSHADELLFAFAKSSATGRDWCIGARIRGLRPVRDPDRQGHCRRAAFLGKAMMGRRFEKTYQAIVAPGAPEPRSGADSMRPCVAMNRGAGQAYMRIRASITADAERARTRYWTLAAADGAALLELKPETGRMHQLRVHLASIGCPIAGDARYGGVLMLAGLPVPRLMLHAAALAFPHPAGERMTLTAPAPRDFRAFADGLRSSAGAA